MIAIINVSLSGETGYGAHLVSVLFFFFFAFVFSNTCIYIGKKTHTCII